MKSPEQNENMKMNHNEENVEIQELARLCGYASADDARNSVDPLNEKTDEQVIELLESELRE